MPKACHTKNSSMQRKCVNVTVATFSRFPGPYFLYFPVHQFKRKETPYEKSFMDTYGPFYLLLSATFQSGSYTF